MPARPLQPRPHLVAHLGPLPGDVDGSHRGSPGVADVGARDTVASKQPVQREQAGPQGEEQLVLGMVARGARQRLRVARRASSQGAIRLAAPVAIT
jgi:hypothetical protein